MFLLASGAVIWANTNVQADNKQTHLPCYRTRSANLQPHQHIGDLCLCIESEAQCVLLSPLGTWRKWTATLGRLISFLIIIYWMFPFPLFMLWYLLFFGPSFLWLISTNTSILIHRCFIPADNSSNFKLAFFPFCFNFK